MTKPLFCSWPINNYWFTNFPAQQGGEFVFRCAVGRASTARGGLAFSRERTLKPRAYFLPPRRAGSLAAEQGSFVRGCPCLQTIKPAEDGDGFIVRLRNLFEAPRAAEVVFAPQLGVRSVEGCDAIEGPKGRAFTFANGKLVAPLAPHAAADFRVRVGAAK